MQGRRLAASTITQVRYSAILVRVVMLMLAHAFCFILSACGSKAVHTPPTKQQGNPQGADEQGLQTNNTPQDALNGQTALVDANFSIKATALGGIKVCEGEVQVKVNIAMKPGDQQLKLFEVPQGEVNCGMIGTINLAEVLGGFAGAQPPEVKEPVVETQDLIAVKVIGMGLYSPPRPMLPAFLTADRARLANLDVTIPDITINDTLENKQGRGTVRVHTMSLGKEYKPQKMQRTFNDVLDFEVINTGFDTVTKINNALFQRMAFKISLDPLAVLNIEFDGSISDYLAAKQAADKNKGVTSTSILSSFMGGGQGGIIGALVGAVSKLVKIHLVMDLTSMHGLEDSAAASKKNQDNGEEIGGKKTGN